MFHQPTRSATKFTKMYTRIFTRHRALRKFGRNSFYSYTQMILYRHVNVEVCYISSLALAPEQTRGMEASSVKTPPKLVVKTVLSQSGSQLYFK